LTRPWLSGNLDAQQPLHSLYRMFSVAMDLKRSSGGLLNRHPHRNLVKVNITLSQQLKPSQHVLFQEIAGEAVLLDLASEQYFGLDPVGTRIWQLLSENGRLEHVFNVLSTEYDVEPAQLQADLLVLANELVAAGIAEVA
jgi:hypothetical protein